MLQFNRFHGIMTLLSHHGSRIHPISRRIEDNHLLVAPTTFSSSRSSLTGCNTFKCLAVLVSVLYQAFNGTSVAFLAALLFSDLAAHDG
jgi:hypothetical protein